MSVSSGRDVGDLVQLALGLNEGLAYLGPGMALTSGIRAGSILSLMESFLREDEDK